jgi:hypothetical protein
VRVEAVKHELKLGLRRYGSGFIVASLQQI